MGCISALSVALFAIGGYNASLAAPFYYGLMGIAAHYAW
jgi:hypothetical protein